MDLVNFAKQISRKMADFLYSKSILCDGHLGNVEFEGFDVFSQNKYLARWQTSITPGRFDGDLGGDKFS